jgi:hypothetical protein
MLILWLSKTGEDYIYYVQRMVGIEIENERDPFKGRTWVPYVNQKREDWNFICDHNRIIKKTDHLVWKFENFIGQPSGGTTKVGTPG